MILFSQQKQGGGLGRCFKVSVEVAQDGEVLSGDPPASVTFAAEETTARLAVATDDDRVVEDAGSVTATLTAGAGYVLGEPSTATVTVADDDSAVFGLSAVPAVVAEGREVRLTVRIEDGVTFATDRSVTLSVGGEVTASDFTLAPATLELPAGYASATASLAAVADGAEETREEARVSALLDGAEVASVVVTLRDASSVARLESLALTDVDIGAFEPETTDYSAEVDNEVAETTVTAEPADANASVVIVDAAGSTLGTERTSTLVEGANAITATVTAEDGVAERTYAVTVTRERLLPWGTRLPDRDIQLSSEGESTGVWSDGETLWALPDWDSGAATAYDLATGGRKEASDLALASDRTQTALHSDGTTLWASGFYGGARAYRLSDGARLPDLDRDGWLTAAGNGQPVGLWSEEEGETLYVVDLEDARVYAYQADGTRLRSAEFGLRSGDVLTGWRWGLWSDGETLLTSFYNNGRVLAYRLSDGGRLTQRDVNTSLAGNDDPRDLWSNGETLWVMDGTDRKLYAYAVPGLKKREASGLLPVRVASRADAVPSADPGPVASIPDTGLRSSIAVALGKSRDAVTGENELAALTALDARDAGIADLSGLEGAVNLAALDLGGNPVSDLRPLAGLAKLETLNLDATGVEAWTLAGFTGLVRLSLRDNGLDDVSALAGLVGLRALDLSGNDVEDAVPLDALPALEALHLDANPADQDEAWRRP